MPNYVKTTLTITGPDDDVKAFVNGITPVIKDNETYYPIFDVYFPMPPALEDTVSPPHGKEEVERQNELAAIYGAGNWYDWQRQYWGVKWGNFETKLIEQSEGRVVFTFKTAWGLATRAWVHISSRFPSLLFHTDSIEEGGFFDGVQSYQNNAVVKDAINRPATRDYWEDEKDDEIGEPE